MSVLTRSFQWLVLAAATLSGTWATAQSFHPFAEPLQFDPDWQWFAPVHVQDFDEMTARQRAPHGWYFGYERIRQGFSRAETQLQSGKIDFTWGNRYEFGLMGNNDSGWDFSAAHISGPNTYNEIYQLRLNGVNTGDTSNPVTPIFPSDFRNDPQYRERVYHIKDSLNAGKYSDYEINKTWRFEPYRYGGILEPLLGLRFAAFTNRSQDDEYTLIPGPTVPLSNTEQFTSDVSQTANNMLLGQLGFRYRRYSQRWTLGGGFKAFAGNNFQSNHFTRTVRTTTYGATPPGIGAAPTTIDDLTGTFFGGDRRTGTVVGMDVRADAAYTLTKSIALHGGVQVLYFGKGIWRQPTGGQNTPDEALTMPGFTFGFSMNR